MIDSSAGSLSISHNLMGRVISHNKAALSGRGNSSTSAIFGRVAYFRTRRFVAGDIPFASGANYWPTFTSGSIFATSLSDMCAMTAGFVVIGGQVGDLIDGCTLAYSAMAIEMTAMEQTSLTGTVTSVPNSIANNKTSIIMLSVQSTNGGTIGPKSVDKNSPGSSFDIISDEPGDSSTVAYLLIQIP